LSASDLVVVDKKSIFVYIVYITKSLRVLLEDYL